MSRLLARQTVELGSLLGEVLQPPVERTGASVAQRGAT
jgi:hypothetical protein